MKELVKPTRLEKKSESAELYNECTFSNYCSWNEKGCDWNYCGYNTETGDDDIVF